MFNLVRCSFKKEKKGKEPGAGSLMADEERKEVRKFIVSTLELVRRAV